MKRSVYNVMSYDGKINKWYKNYRSSYKFCQKLIAKDIWCVIYQWNDSKNDMECIIGC